MKCFVSFLVLILGDRKSGKILRYYVGFAVFCFGFSFFFLTEAITKLSVYLQILLENEELLCFLYV